MRGGEGGERRRGENEETGETTRCVWVGMKKASGKGRKQAKNGSGRRCG